MAVIDESSEVFIAEIALRTGFKSPSHFSRLLNAHSKKARENFVL
jgi:transcriptional regulator GlxA family with amidase domain